MSLLQNSAEQPYFICGLGNPGREYAKNRHNVGFQCLDLLAQKWRLEFGRLRFKASVATGQVDSTRVILAKPLTFMNNSGEAVSPLVHYYRVPLCQLLIIYDDLDLPLGKIRLRPNGSAGGHNGIISIIRQLGTQEFARLRVGIGRPEHGEPYDHVLGNFTTDQLIVMQETYQLAVLAVECFLQEGIQTAMNKFNG